MIKIATRGVTEDVDVCSGAVITVAAGESWDPLVSYAIERGWSGLETMSGIPGLVGATPIQNVGAYGAEVSELISTVRTLDRSTGQLKTLFGMECGFGYRTSRFKTDPGHFLVLSATSSFTHHVAIDSLSRACTDARRQGGAACSGGRCSAGRASAAHSQGHGFGRK